MLKQLCILLFVISLCYAQDGLQETGRKKHKYHHHLAHHGVYYYLAFLAVKAKIAFLIGTMIFMVLFASKFFALVQYGFLNKKSEPQKIYIQSTNPHPSYYSPEVYNSHESHDYAGYERSLGDSIFDNMDMVKEIIQKLNLTESAFNSANMTNTACRERFVCEADFQARNSIVLSLSMYIFNDSELDKYRHNNTVIRKVQDCAQIYQNCPSLPSHIKIM